MQKQLNPARLLAFWALRNFSNGQNIETALKNAIYTFLKQNNALDPRDQALAVALSYEVIRHRTYIDWLIKSFLSQPEKSLSDALQNILRLGFAQGLYFERLPSHAILMETVNLSKTAVPGNHNFVNAVLRTFFRAKKAHKIPQIPQKPDFIKYLAINYSTPSWLIKKYLTIFNLSETEELLKASNLSVPPTLRINQTLCSREQLIQLLKDNQIETKPTDFSPWGLKLLNFQGKIESIPGFKEGFFSVQDEASQIAIMLAEVESNQLILDACAGLGGKTMALANLNQNKNSILALDIDDKKLNKMPPEIKRLKLTNIRIEEKNLLQYEPKEKFDLIFLDAPCSGLGAIRRRPDIKWNKKENDPKRLAELQFRLLKKAAQISKKQKSQLIYAVCTISHEETNEVVERFLKSCPEAKLETKNKWPQQLQPLLSSNNTLTLYPHKNQTDGFFIASFRLNT